MAFHSKRYLRTLEPKEVGAQLGDWQSLWAHPSQREPPGADWRIWLLLGGRGAGKTRAGAEWINNGARTGRFARIALVAPTFHDVREVMIESASGVLACAEARPTYEASRRRLVWPNGAQAHCFSAEDPASLRGPQFDAAWGDEIAYWARPQEMLDTLAFALRLGSRPLTLLTTTPRPMRVLTDLAARKDVAVVRATTARNGRNLAPSFVEALEARYGGTTYARQELLGELIADPEGAAWTRAQLDALRVAAPPDGLRVVMAIDPPASVGPDADACGMVVVGAEGEGFARRAVVLADASAQGLSPEGWAARAAHTAHTFDVDYIVAEANNGGEMVRTVLRLAAPHIPVRLVYASRGKAARAEPVVMLYEQGRVRHAGSFPAMEDEMCAFGAPQSSVGKDRVDALVWAITDLCARSISRVWPKQRPICSPRPSQARRARPCMP